MATEEFAGDLPDDRPLQIFVCGRKGSGKSELTHVLWQSWPDDRVVIDVPHDFIAKGHEDRLPPEERTQHLDSPVPARWPAHLKDPGQPRLSLTYEPDVGADDYREEMDRVVGMAYTHGDCLIVIEEVGLVAPAGQTLPHTRRLLHMGRHHRVYSVLNAPRPMDIDPLVIANADVVYVFDLPQPADRKRVADNIGYSPREFDQAVGALPDHGYLRYVAARRELLEFPPLPMPKRQRNADRAFQGDPS